MAASRMLTGYDFMGLKTIILAMILSLCLSHHRIEGERSISKEEDLEFDRQLKILNKPPIKTIQTEWGDILDCIDINKQPAFDHPLLKNHKIQMRPSSFPKGVTDKTSSKIKPSRIRYKSKECPQGTVPIRRTRKEDLIRAKYFSKGHDTLNDQRFPDQHRLDLQLLDVANTTYYGAKAHISTYNLTVAEDQFSTAQIWIVAGPPEQINNIQAGWDVAPLLYGDHLTRQFTYWTGDGYNKRGCYNTLCPGFVQVDKALTPSAPVSNTSTYGGDQYELVNLVYQDRETGNWWLVVQENNVLVGYWPKSLFTHLAGGADTIFWGAGAKAGANGVSPPLGNGYVPHGDFYKACYFRQIQYVNESNALSNPQVYWTEKHVDCSKYYKLDYYGYRGKSMGHTFMFGGPGGKCG